MALQDRYIIQDVDPDGFRYRARIQQEAAASTLELTGADTPFTWGYGASGQLPNPDEPLPPSSLSIEMLDTDGVLASISGAAPDAFPVIFERQPASDDPGTDPWQTLWRGFLLTRDFKDDPELWADSVTLKAHDGLNLLKTQTYEGASESETVWQTLFAILDSLGYGFDYHTIMRWYPYLEDHLTSRVLEKLYIQDEVWEDERNSDLRLSKYDVLEELVGRFGMQLIQSGGTWHLRQRFNLTGTQAVQEIYSGATGAYASTTSGVDTVNVDAISEAQNRPRSFLAKAAQVEVTHEHGEIRGIVRNPGFEAAITALDWQEITPPTDLAETGRASFSSMAAFVDNLPEETTENTYAYFVRYVRDGDDSGGSNDLLEQTFRGLHIANAPDLFLELRWTAGSTEKSNIVWSPEWRLEVEGFYVKAKECPILVGSLKGKNAQLSIAPIEPGGQGVIIAAGTPLWVGDSASPFRTKFTPNKDVRAGDHVVSGELEDALPIEGGLGPTRLQYFVWTGDVTTNRWPQGWPAPLAEDGVPDFPLWLEQRILVPLKTPEGVLVTGSPKLTFGLFTAQVGIEDFTYIVDDVEIRLLGANGRPVSRTTSAAAVATPVDELERLNPSFLTGDGPTPDMAGRLAVLDGAPTPVRHEITGGWQNGPYGGSDPSSDVRLDELHASMVLRQRKKELSTRWITFYPRNQQSILPHQVVTRQGVNFTVERYVRRIGKGGGGSCETVLLEHYLGDAGGITTGLVQAGPADASGQSRTFLAVSAGAGGGITNWASITGKPPLVNTFNGRDGAVTLTPADVTGALGYTPWHAGNDGPGSGLNADLLDGLNAGNASGLIPISNGTVNTNLNADLLDGFHAGNGSGQIPVSNGALNTNLNAEFLGGFNAAAFPRKAENATISGAWTYTNDVLIAKNNPWLTLDSPGTGTNENEQGAGISIGEGGKKGGPSLHLTYTGEGQGHIGMGAFDTTTGKPPFSRIQFTYNADLIRFFVAEAEVVRVSPTGLTVSTTLGMGTGQKIDFATETKDDKIDLYGGAYLIGVRGSTWFARSGLTFQFETPIGNNSSEAFKVNTTGGQNLLSITGAGTAKFYNAGNPGWSQVHGDIWTIRYREPGFYGYIQWERSTGTRGAYLGWGSPGSYIEMGLEDGNAFRVTGGWFQPAGGMTSPTFASGFTGTGWRVDSTGNAEVASLVVRGQLRIYELLLQQIRATNGSVFVTSGIKASTVSNLGGGTWRVVLETGENYVPFVIGDLIQARRFYYSGSSRGNLFNVFGTVIGVDNTSSPRYFDFTLASGSNDPSAGMDFVRYGNNGTDTNRQGGIYLTSDDSHAPYIDIYNGLSNEADYANLGGNGRLKARLGRLSGIADDTWGTLVGYGIYTSNGYFTGRVSMNEGYIGTPAEGWFVNSTGIQNGNIRIKTRSLQTSEPSNSLSIGYWNSNATGPIVRVRGSNGEVVHMHVTAAGAAYLEAHAPSSTVVTAAGNITSFQSGMYGFLIRQGGSNVFYVNQNEMHAFGWTANASRLYNETVYLGRSVGAVNGTGRILIGQWDANSLPIIRAVGSATNTYIDMRADGTNWGLYGYISGVQHFGLSTSGLFIHGTGTFTGSVTITGGSGYGNLSDRPTSLGAINASEGGKLSGIQAGATVGATWGTNLSNIPVRFADTPSGTGLYLSATHMGYYASGTWRTYMDNSGNFYLGGTGGKLRWTAGTNTLFIDGSGVFTGSITITGTSSGYSNLSDRPTSLSGINGAEGTKLSGIQAGATAGATWGANLSNIPVRFADSPAGAGLYLSATHMGYYSGSAWQSYINSSGHFHFGGSASNYVEWNGSTLTVSGAITATTGNIAGTLTMGASGKITTSSTDYDISASGIHIYHGSSFSTPRSLSIGASPGTGFRIWRNSGLALTEISDPNAVDIKGGGNAIIGLRNSAESFFEIANSLRIRANSGLLIDTTGAAGDMAINSSRDLDVSSVRTLTLRSGSSSSTLSPTIMLSTTNRKIEMLNSVVILDPISGSHPASPGLPGSNSGQVGMYCFADEIWLVRVINGQRYRCFVHHSEWDAY
jgi:hypothetical protein